jgi:hypothetical protein
MAKKSKKKASSKRKARAKASRRPAPARKAPARSSASPVQDVGTGRGPGPAELGAQLVAAFNAGRGDEWIHTRWSPGIVSIEGQANTQWVGKKTVMAKGEEWFKLNTVLGGSAEGPFVGATGFAVKFRMHVRENATGAEQHAEEVGVYTVQDGKITREEFMGRA